MAAKLILRVRLLFASSMEALESLALVNWLLLLEGLPPMIQLLTHSQPNVIVDKASPMISTIHISWVCLMSSLFSLSVLADL